MKGYEDFFKIVPNGSLIAGNISGEKINNTVFIVKESKDNIISLENNNEVKIVSVVLNKKKAYGLLLMFNFLANNKIYFYWIDYYSKENKIRNTLNNLCSQNDVNFIFSDESLDITKTITIPIECVKNNLKRYRAISQESMSWNNMDFELLKYAIYNKYPSIEDFWNDFK